MHIYDRIMNIHNVDVDDHDGIMDIHSCCEIMDIRDYYRYQ